MMPQVSLNGILFIIIIYYHSVNGISYGVAQSDHIKRQIGGGGGLNLSIVFETYLNSSLAAM
jgi:hypothetical protein